MKKRMMAAVMATVLCVGGITGCSTKTESTAPAAETAGAAAGENAGEAAESVAETSKEAGEAKKDWEIVVMPKAVGLTYFEAARAGVEKADAELEGVHAVFTGPTVADAAEQVKMIQDLISQGVDAICVSANDAAALTPVLRQAREAGIVILDWDSPAEESVVDLSVKEIDYKTYAQANWDAMVETMGEEGEYAILTSTLTAGTCNEWISFGKEYAAEKYPNLKLVTDPVCTNESVQEAYTKTLDLITTYPDLKGIIGFSSPAPIGAGQAIQEKGLEDAITVVGSAMPNDAREYVHDGSIDKVLLWDPARLGYVTVFLARQILEGVPVTDGEMEVPGFGTITVNGHAVIMGDPAEFDDANIDDFDF